MKKFLLSLITVLYLGLAAFDSRGEQFVEWETSPNLTEATVSVCIGVDFEIVIFAQEINPSDMSLVPWGTTAGSSYAYYYEGFFSNLNLAAENTTSYILTGTASTIGTTMIEMHSGSYTLQLNVNVVNVPEPPQYGADFACTGEKLVLEGANGGSVASLSEVAVGDVYEYSIEGTADFTGEMYIALVDHSEEVDWWLEMAQSTAIQVAEGEQFEYSGTFTVETQTTSTTPEFLLMIGHGDAETGSISQVCITNASIRKPTVYTVSDITLCEYQTIASVTVTAEPAAIFEVVSETGDVIQSFSGETSYANFNISDLTVGAYKYYIKENGAAKDSFNITVYANPTVTITTSPESICVGDEVSFIANATGNDLTYQWENSSLEIADATSETAKWQSTVAGQYPISCTVTGEGGCTASAELVFLVNPIPVVEIEGSSEVTAGEDVTYTASVTYEGESTFVYNWTGVAQGSDQTLTTTFTDEGLSNLYCEVVTREGCKGADTLEVTVSEPPFVCDNDEITLAYSREISTGMYSYTYLYENVVTTAAKGDTFVMEWKGTSNFTGEMNICLIDRSEEASYWSEISNWESIYVEKDVPFSVIKSLTINSTLSSVPELVLFISTIFEKQKEGVKLCQTDFSIKKEEIVKVFEMYYNEYGENWQRHYPETQTEVLQAVYEATGESEYVPVMEDVFMLSITGKANYTGSLDFYIVDERQEVGYWQELTSSKGTSVSEGEYFSVQVPLTVTQTLYNKIRLNQAGLQINAKPIYVISNLGTTDTATITLSEYSFTFIPSGGQLEVLKTITLNYDEYASDEDDDGISDSWRRDGNTNTNEFGDLIREKTGLYSYYMASLFGHDEYYTPKVGDKLTYSMKGTADFTGRMSCALIDESAEVCYYAEFSSYNETYVNEGEPFVFEGELVITNVESICKDNPARMMNPEFHISIFPSVTSTNAEFDNTKEYTLSLTDYTLDFIVDDYECDGTRLMFGSAESLNSLQKSIADEITEETTFNLSWTGTPNFTGLVQAVVIDASEEFNGMVLSQPIVGIEVEANKAFTVNQDVVVSASKSSKPNYVIEIFVPYQAEGFKATAPTVDICETEFSFVKVEQQPVSVSFSQSSYEISAGGSELICLVTEGIDLSKATITYNESSNLSVKDKNEGCVIVTDQNGVASIQQIEAVVIYNNKEYTATADIQIIEEQPNCEGTFVTFTSAEETYGGTTYYFYESSHDVEIYNASEDDTFEFEWSFTPNFSANSVSVALVDLSNNNSSSATTYFTEGSNRTQTFNFSLPEGNNEKSTYAIKTTIQSNEIIENATLCESYFSFKKVEKSPYVKVFATEYNQWGSSTDGDNISDGWQSGFDEFPTAVYEATGNTEWTPAIGDVFSVSMQGVANFTGTVNFFMVDQREAAGYWGVASEHVPGFYVVEGEPFNITDYFAVTSTGNDDVTYAPNFVVLCQPNVTSTSDDFSEFVTYKLLLTNYDLSFYPSTLTGTCDGNLITTLNAGLIDVSHYVDNAIVEGDKVTVNWSATPDFTGDLSVALVDGRNTAEDAWLFMTNAISFEVTKDVAFEVSMPFDIIDTHINPFYQMYIAVNDREGSADVYNICSSEITVTIKKEEDIPVECDGNLIKITGQYGDNYHVDGVPTVGDVYDVELTITPNFSGELWLNVTDKSFMNSISKQQKISLVEGVTTETTISFEIIENSSADYSEGFELTKLIRPNSTEGTFYLCESNFSIKKHKELPNYVKVFNLTYDEWGADVDDDEIADNWRTTTIAYESLGVDTYAPGIGDQVEYRFKGVADFTGKISLGLIDNREAACFYAEFSDYNDYYVTEGEEFVIEGSLAVSRIEGSCDESAVELINPLLNISCFPDVTSTNADFTTYKMYSLSLTDYSLVYEQKQVDCYLPMEFDGMNSVVISYIYEDVAVGDEYYAHVTGVSDFTGDLFFSFVDQSEEVDWWYMLDDETKSISVIEGMPFEFEGYFTVTNEVISTQPNIHLTVGRVDDEGTGEITTACATSVEFSKHEQTNNYVKIIKTSYNEYGADRDGDGVSDEWHRDDTSDFSELTNAVYDATGNKVWTPEVGESFFLEMEGVADFTGTVTVLLVDEREEVNWWTELSPYVSFDVTEGEIFNYTTILGIQTIETVEGVALTEPHFQVTCAPDNTSTNSNFVTGKAMTLSFTNFTMDYYPNPSSVCDGNMITIPFYRTSVEKEDEYAYNTYRSVDIESVSKGDEFTLTWSGTADFDGTINVALTDQSVEAFWFTRLSDFYQVAELVEGEKFSLSVPLSIIENASSEPVYKLAIFVVTPKKAAHLTICEDNFSLQKPQAFSIGFDEPDYVFEKVGEEQLICVNISGSYDGDVMYEYDESIIELIDSQYGERCKILKALKPGRTHLFASVMYDGEKREAGAAISVEGSTSNDYTLTFDQKMYEVTEGESFRACLTIGDGFEEFQPEFEFNSDVISIANPTDHSDCGIITGLTAGQTTVVVSAYANGVRYADTTFVIVNQKPALDYTLAFEKRTYEMYEGETVEACMIMGNAFEHDFHPEMVYDETVIAVNEPTEQQSDNCGSITGLKAGNSVLIIYTEIDEERYGDTVFVVVTKKDIQVPQMEVPVVTTNEIKLCYSKTQQDTIMLDAFVQVTSDNARLKWYDAAGNALISAPLIDPKTVGKRIYYVSQIASGYNESEKVALSVNIVYVAAPELNIYEQKVCDNTETKAFVAKSQNNEIYWYQGEGNPIAQNTNTFMPSEAGTYLVRAIDVANGCVSDFATVNYAVGHTIRPQIEVEKTEYALDEKIVLAVQAVDEEQYGVVWTIEGEVVQGTTATVVFAEEGNYKIPCTIVEKESGCYASDTVVITVEKTLIPVSTIAVQPSSIEMYEGEQSYLALTFTPAFATDKNYVIEVADTTIADVVGLTVFGLKEGETTAIISSTSNSSATASITITVKKFVAAREISLPTVITMAPEETKTISAAVLPTNASYNEVFFTEKEDNVIRLSANGELTALAEGTSIITAYTKGGLKASSVVVVTSSVAAITDIQVPERIEMKVGDSVSVSYKVVPATSLISQLNWAIGDEEMISFANGVVKAEKAGSTTLTVSFASIEKSIAIVVNESDAPVVITTPNVSATQGDDVKVDLTDVISDDNTAIEDLTVTTTSDKFNVAVENGVLTVIPKDNSFVGVDTVTVVVIDENNLSVELPVVVEITGIQNQAPEILMDTIMIKYNACNYIQLSELVSDDFTPYNKMKYSFTSNVKASVMLRKQLRLFTDNPDLESDILTMTVTDAEGVSTTKDILLLLTALPNKAPKIAEIPTQNENDESKFGTIDLAQYVKDDYTSSSAIAWSAADAENLAVTISDGKATVKVLNEFWNGAAAVTFYAKDEEGLTDSTVVYYVRNVTIKKEDPSQEPTTEVVATWEGAPSFDFMTMRTIGVPGAQFILMASCSGYECTWSWDIPGAKGVDPTSLMQMITFDEPGTYDVTFTVQSPDGNFEKSITKENFLTVVGISERTPAICKGEAVVLTATEGLDSYYWSTGDVKNTTTDRPEETALYQVTMKKGMFTLIDTVTVKVSVPVSLMEDSVMCKGTTFDLEAEGEFVSYTWNTGESTKAIALPDVVASYSVMAVDDMQCVSVDTFNLTTVNELPVIDLGPDQTPCDGTTVTLDAGTGFDYLWKNGSTEQTISLTAGTDTVWARIIDNNLCVNYDTVVVAFTYPYPEQLGVATASETTDHVILAWEKTAGVNTQSYVIERETYETDRWDPVGDTVDFTQPGLVVDEWVNSKQTAYKYRLATIDGCGNKAISEVHRTMHSMRVPDPETGLMQIRWTGYEPIRQQDGTATIKQYIILRGTEGNMDSVGFIPASSNEYIWTETDASMMDLKTIKYRVAFRLSHPVNENAVNTLDGQPVEGYYTKAESGPFSLALSNIAEAENNDAVEDVAFPADVVVYPSIVKDVINVLIASPKDEEFTVEVVNANGQTVKTVETGEVQSTLVQIQASNLTQGVYNVRVKAGDQVKVIKVVK